MAGEIATAFVAMVPSMKGFGSEAARQIGPQATAVGARAGRQAGVAFTSAAAKESENWFASTAKGAIKNVTLYGSMYAAIQAADNAIRAALGSMVGFNAEIEQATIGFETLLGSSRAAKSQMDWIKDFAKETPFNYKDLVGYSQQLIALGFNGEQAKDVLQATGDAAAALGRGSESIARINLALGQMWTKGKVQSQEMLQLTEAGIGAWQILADAYGTTVENIQEAVTAGQIKAADAVPAIIAGMNARFGGLMEKQSQTFTGIVSNIQDTLQQELADAGEPLFRELTADSKRFLDGLKDPEVQKTLADIGEGLATGAHFMAEAAGFAWDYRNAILEIGIAYTASKLLSRSASPLNALIGNATSGTGSLAVMRQASAAAATAAQTQAAYNTVLAQSVTTTAAANAAALELAAAKAALAAADQAVTTAEANQAALGRNAVGADERVTATHAARTQAAARLAAAETAVATANLDAALTSKQLANADAAATAAAEANTAAQASRAKVLAGLKQTMGTVGQAVGLLAAVDGIRRAAEGAKDAQDAYLGFAEATASGALVGATLGTTVFPGIGTGAGAAAGAVAGLTASVVAYQQAVNAANKDTSAMRDLLEGLGIDATVAGLALGDVTNAQLTALGGAQEITKALSQGSFDDFIATQGSHLEDLRHQYEALETQLESLRQSNVEEGIGYDLNEEALVTQVENAKAAYEQLERAIDSVSDSSFGWEAAQQQVIASGYEAAYAADLQTGALGKATEAAWNAVVAAGGLSTESLNAAIRMEGLAGVAGYATQMIAGIPKGTAINFTTNALEVAQKIAALKAMSGAATHGGASYDNYLASLQDQLKKSLTTSVSTLSLPSIPSSWRGGGGSSRASRAADEAANAARRAAEEAARKLEQDRSAQVRFGDAFGSLMEAALEGNFDQYRERLQEQITSLTRDGYTKAADALKQQSVALTQSALDYAALVAKLNTASDAYDDLTGKMREQYNTSRDLILGLGKATDAQSFDQLAYLLGETTSRASEYQDVLTQLKAQGLSEDLWNQLAQAGPESMALAQSILAQGQAGIDQLNSLSDGLVGAADSMGSLVADSMYQQGAEAMEAYIDGLKSQSTALEAQLETIANTVLNKTAGAITPGNAGYQQISTAPQQVVNQVSVTIDTKDLDDLKKIQDFLAMLNQAPTTQLVNQAGTVTS